MRADALNNSVPRLIKLTGVLRFPLSIWFFDKLLFPASLSAMILQCLFSLFSSTLRIRVIRFGWSLVSMSAVLAIECSAAELPIINQSFETPVLSDGTFIPAGAAPGWVPQGTAEIHNPNNSFFSGTTTGAPNNPIDGFNAASVNAGSKLTYQDANWIIRSNMIYQLTFLVGHRIGVPFGNPTVSLWAGTNLLA